MNSVEEDHKNVLERRCFKHKRIIIKINGYRHLLNINAEVGSANKGRKDTENVNKNTSHV